MSEWNKYSIRPLEQGDSKLIEAYFGTLSEATKMIFPGYPFTAEEASRLAVEEVNHPGIMRYVIIDPSSTDVPGRMIATLWFWDWDCMVPWIGLMIADDYQGKGLGKAMLKYAVSEARNNGKGGILLTTHKENTRGLTLYARYGFKIIGEDARGEHLMLLRY